MTAARTLFLCSSLLSLAGCGNETTYPVSGQILLADGTPLAGGQIEFRGLEKPVSATGSVQSDGRFRLGLHGQEDGAYAGRYRIAIIPPAPPLGIPGHQDEDAIQAEARTRWLSQVPAQFHSATTSGLERTVTTNARQNDFLIQLPP